MNVRFYIDPATHLSHIYNHNVKENEVEDVLRRLGRTGRVKKILELLSGKRKPVDIFE